MFYLTPFAGPWLQMTDRNNEAGFIRKFSQVRFTKPKSVRIAIISGDQLGGCLRINLPPHSNPPAADNVRGKCFCLIVRAGVPSPVLRGGSPMAGTGFDIFSYRIFGSKSGGELCLSHAVHFIIQHS